MEGPAPLELCERLVEGATLTLEQALCIAGNYEEGIKALREFMQPVGTVQF